MSPPRPVDPVTHATAPQDDVAASSPTMSGLHVVPIEGRTRGLILSPFDGRYGPMDPVLVRQLVRELLDMVDLDGMSAVLGIPEGGNAPAFAFAEEAGLKVVYATRLRPNLPAVLEFTEHEQDAWAHQFYVAGLVAGDGVIIVEDEVTSGRTVIQAARAMRRAGMRCEQVATLLAVDDPAMRERVSAAGLRLATARWLHPEILARMTPST